MLLDHPRLQVPTGTLEDDHVRGADALAVDTRLRGHQNLCAVWQPQVLADLVLQSPAARVDTFEERMPKCFVDSEQCLREAILEEPSLVRYDRVAIARPSLGHLREIARNTRGVCG